MSTSRLFRRCHGCLVLALEEDELARLDPVELVQPVELALVEREHGLELVEPRGGAVDVVLQRADLGGDDGDLRGEHALALPRGRSIFFASTSMRASMTCFRSPIPSCPEAGETTRRTTGQQKAGGDRRKRIRG